jgi:RHS repeat-associated protein
LRSNKLEERREELRDLNDPNKVASWQRNKWTYSGSNKVLTATDPLGYVSKSFYDSLDRLTSTQDPELRTNKFEYDLDLRITKVIDANNVDADIRTYTANGKLKTIKDARNNVSTWTFDGHDRKSRLTYPDASYEEWQYDNNGNVTSYRTRSGTLITQTFDDYDRLATRSPASQPVETYSYDNAGKLLSVSTPVVAGNPASGTFSRGYDAAGRLTSETNPQGQTIDYQLDKNGNVTRITYPDPLPTRYYVDRVFDELNRLTAIRLNNPTTVAASFQYDRLSRRTKLTFLNGVVTDYLYDLADRRTGMDITVGGVPSRWRYGFNKVDQMTSQKFPDSTWEWRPTAGNTTYGAANNLNQIPSISGGITLSYADGRGNLTGDGTWTYVFNTENMLTSATKSGTTASFDYDPANRQIRKTVNGTQTRYVYSGDQLIAEYDNSTGNLLRRYVYAFGKDDPIMQLDASNNVTYLHADHLGSIIAQSNAAGAIGNKYSYSPHGQSVSLTGTVFGFTGQRFDSELGLYYYKARYYSPALCRFLQADPAGYDVGYNLYPYAKNDPLSVRDPSGKVDEEVGEPIQIKSAWDEAGGAMAQGVENASNIDDAVGMMLGPIGIAKAAGKGVLKGGIKGVLFDALKGSQRAQGPFSIATWYRDKMPQYPGAHATTKELTLLAGDAYKSARDAADTVNDFLRDGIRGHLTKKRQIHENIPVKFGGDPIDPSNKIIINTTSHRKINSYWKELQRWAEGKID